MHWLTTQLPLLSALAGIVSATASLDSVCTTAYAKASLPKNGTIPGITIKPSSVVVGAVKNSSYTGQLMFPDATISYCSVDFAYSHNGKSNNVNVRYWLPAPANFQNRFLTTGGGGYAINSGNQSLPGGIIYGASAGITDGGFGSFATNYDIVNLIANNSLNYDLLYSFGYKGIHEMAIIGQAFTKSFFNMTSACNSTKLYTYYQGCSEGGREGFSQVQRYGSQFDGAIIGAPALRYSFQQVQHLWSNVVEQTLDYNPPPCELATIVNATLKSCDGLDGKIDGVVARSDLCKLHFNINSTLGTPYYCAAAQAAPFPPAPATPAHHGIVSAKGIAVAQAILDGARDNDGKQIYFSYQPAATFADAQTQYNSTSDSWMLYLSALGGEWVERWLYELQGNNLPSLTGVTYDTIRDWTIQGLEKYSDVLQTTWPDLTPFHEAGGKILHYHGESDNSIPAASSVRYYESVQSIMYPNSTYNASVAALDDWYRLFLVPGAAHCSTNTLQPNGPWCQTNLAVMIDWVEQGVVPVTLNATHLAGSEEGQNAQICSWPLRPYWASNTSAAECVYDQASIDTWRYELDAIPVPVY